MEGIEPGKFGKSGGPRESDASFRSDMAPIIDSVTGDRFLFYARKANNEAFSYGQDYIYKKGERTSADIAEEESLRKLERLAASRRHVESRFHKNIDENTSDGSVYRQSELDEFGNPIQKKEPKGPKQHVINGKRDYKTSAASQIKRKRAGRYGRMIGEGSDDDENSDDDSDFGDSS